MRGGRRPNSGRKALPEELKRVPLSVSVSPATFDTLCAMSRLTGLHIGHIIDTLIKDTGFIVTPNK